MSGPIAGLEMKCHTCGERVVINSIMDERGTERAGDLRCPICDEAPYCQTCYGEHLRSHGCDVPVWE